MLRPCGLERGYGHESRVTWRAHRGKETRAAAAKISMRPKAADTTRNWALHQAGVLACTPGAPPGNMASRSSLCATKRG